VQEMAQVYTFTDFSLPLPACGYQPRGRDEGLALGQPPGLLLSSASREIAVEVWQEGGNADFALDLRDYGGGRFFVGFVCVCGALWGLFLVPFACQPRSWSDLGRQKKKTNPVRQGQASSSPQPAPRTTCHLGLYTCWHAAVGGGGPSLVGSRPGRKSPEETTDKSGPWQPPSCLACTIGGWGGGTAKRRRRNTTTHMALSPRPLFTAANMEVEMEMGQVVCLRPRLQPQPHSYCFLARTHHL
jgi:hypothetical protein